MDPDRNREIRSDDSGSGVVLSDPSAQRRVPVEFRCPVLTLDLEAFERSRWRRRIKSHEYKNIHAVHTGPVHYMKTKHRKENLSWRR
jgi:hypothetical protein